MRALIVILVAIALSPAKAANIELGLAEDRVEVDTGFAGAKLTLFGAITGIDDPANTVDIVSVIRGPDARFQIREIEKANLIWVPGATHLVESAPGLYLTNSTKPVTDIVPLPLQDQYRLGADFLDIEIHTQLDEKDEIDKTVLYREAFLTEVKALGLYEERIDGIAFSKGALFTINARLPANTPVGEYTVSVYLFRNGELLSSDQAELGVNRVGLERRIYDFAFERPISYGIFCVIISLLAGWLASVAFRK